MKELIKKLSDLRGISGFEYKVTDEIEKIIAPFVDKIEYDSLGNLIAIKKSKAKNAKKVMIEAHSDEIGLMVSGISENGFLRFVAVGGVDRRILPSLEVTVHGKKDIKGVIFSKPPHLQQEGEQEKLTKITDMAIDTGFSFDDVSEYVSIGDVVSFENSFGALLKKSYSAKTLDDRAGCAVLIDVMKKLEKESLDVDVYCVISTQEEVGLRGAKTAVFNVNPDIAISVDVCHAITPDNSKDAYEAGNGVVITTGPNIHPKLFKRLTTVAKDNKVKYMVDADGGDTGTNAWVEQVSGEGIPTGLLSIPLKYMHTSVETINLDDAKNCAKLLRFFIKGLSFDMEEWLCL